MSKSIGFTKKEEKEIDTNYNRLPVCPWCGVSHHDWWDGTSLNSDGDEEEATCLACGKKYLTRFHLEARFTTGKIFK